MTRLRVLALAICVLMLAGLYMVWPRRETGLVIYSSVGAAPAVATAFTAETGIPAHVVSLSGGALLARIAAEAHHPHWTIVWFEGDPAAAALDHAGLLAKNTTPALSWNDEGRMLLPPDGAWTPTGFTLAGVFAYRADVVTWPMAGWRELIDTAPKLPATARFGMPDPALSGPTFPMLAGMIMQGGGWPAGRALVQSLKAQGLRIFPSGPSLALALRSGEIGVALTQSSTAYTLAAGDPRFRVQLPRPATMLPSLAAIAADAPPSQRATAQRFIAFAMTPRIQGLRMSQPTSDRLFWPVTIDTTQPNLPPLAASDLLHPSPDIWGPLQAAVTDWFEQEIAGP